MAAFSLIPGVVALLAAGLILVPAAFALRGATTLDWITGVSGVGIGAALTLLFNGNKEKPTSSGVLRPTAGGTRDDSPTLLAKDGLN